MPDFFSLKSIAYLEMYVGNAKQAAHYFQTAFGFQPLAYLGPETGVQDKVSYVLEQGEIRMVLTSALHPASEIAAHFHMHGDGVRTIALEVKSVTRAFNEVVSKGARILFAPRAFEDEQGQVIMAGIHTYGDTIHILLEKSKFDGVFLPGFEPWAGSHQSGETGLRAIDHIMGNVGWNEMKSWCNFYEKAMGFTRMKSVVDSSLFAEFITPMIKPIKNGRVKFPIREPAKQGKKSRIEKYLDFYKGPGVQYIALATDNIFFTIRQLRRGGITFLPVGDTYDDAIIPPGRISGERLKALHHNHIRIKRDEEGYSLQSCTQPIADRSTVCFKIVQRVHKDGTGQSGLDAMVQTLEDSFDVIAVP